MYFIYWKQASCIHSIWLWKSLLPHAVPHPVAALAPSHRDHEFCKVKLCQKCSALQWMVPKNTKKENLIPSSTQNRVHGWKPQNGKQKLSGQNQTEEIALDSQTNKQLTNSGFATDPDLNSSGSCNAFQLFVYGWHKWRWLNNVAYQRSWTFRFSSWLPQGRRGFEDRKVLYSELSSLQYDTDIYCDLYVQHTWTGQNKSEKTTV